MKTAHLSFSALALIALACGGSDDKQVKSPETTAGQSNTPPVTNSDPKPGSATNGTTPGVTPLAADNTAAMKNDTSATKNDAPTMVNLTDDQILQVVHSANVGEVAQAKVAQKKAKNARVKKFADMMVAHHTDADKKGVDTGKKAKINMTDSSVSSNLESEAKGFMTTLDSTAAGGDFDKAYIDAQVKEHQTVLDLIDQKLSPKAQNPDLKSYLSAVREKVAGHLKEAQEIQKTM